jgi:PhnB protein
MLNLTPFLLFDDNCAEAVAFCQSCLGGELIITTVGDTSMKTQVPPENIRR